MPPHLVILVQMTSLFLLLSQTFPSGKFFPTKKLFVPFSIIKIIIITGYISSNMSITSDKKLKIKRPFLRIRRYF